jgi:hypothetical protein
VRKTSAFSADLVQLATDVIVVVYRAVFEEVHARLWSRYRALRVSRPGSSTCARRRSMSACSVVAAQVMQTNKIVALAAQRKIPVIYPARQSQGPIRHGSPWR